MKSAYTRKGHGCHIGWIVLIIYFSLRAAFAGPLVVVESTINPQFMVISVAGVQLPDMKRFTLTCSYNLPVTTLRDAIVSSPLPATSLSVLLDTVTATLSITLHATTTVAPMDNTLVVKVKIPAVPSTSVADFSVNNALVVDPQGTSTGVPIEYKTHLNWSRIPLNHRTAPGYSAEIVEVFRLDGKKAVGGIRQRACSCGIVLMRSCRSTVVVTVR